MQLVPPSTTTQSALSFSDVESELTSTLFKPDTQAFRVVLAAVASHTLQPHGYPPTWVMVVGPSGSGKTTCLSTLALIPNAHFLGDLSPRTFVSGYNKKNANGKPNSLLHRWGASPIAVIKDFTTLLSMRHENKSEIMSQLREIHDGFHSRETGTGDHIAWAGRLTLIACCTPAIDHDRMTSRTMGDRFVEVRWDGPPPVALARRVSHNVTPTENLKLLRTLVNKYLSASDTTCPSLTNQQGDDIGLLAATVAILRTPVMRDDRGYKIMDVGTPESPTRLAQAMTSVVLSSSALDHSRIPRPEDMALAKRISRDSIPPARLLILEAITSDGTSSSSLYDLPISRWSRDRALDDLDALGLIENHKSELNESVYFLTNYAETLGVALLRV